MKEKNQFGKLIRYEREKAELKYEEICIGLCARSTLVRIEAGERKCERILADALLQRIGVSSDKFVYVANSEEQDWLVLRERLIEAVETENTGKARQLIDEYRTITENGSRLHKQFLLILEVVLSWKKTGAKKELLSKLRTAWKISMPVIQIDQIATQNLTLNEFVIAMMYHRIQEDLHLKDVAIPGYERLLAYLEQCTDEEDRVKLYPQISYHLVRLYLQKEEYTKAVRLSIKAIKLLQIRGRLFYLRQHLEILNQYGTLEPSTRYAVSEICSSLKWLYQQYGTKEERWVWNIPFGMAEVELYSNLIRNRREALGWSQEKLSENVCDPVSISRIECNRVAPKRKIASALLDKVGRVGESFETVVQVERPDLFEKAIQISILLSHSKAEEAEPLILEMENGMRNSNRFAKQYLLYVKALALFDLKKISAEEFRDMQEEALYMTLPHMDSEHIRKWCFSRQEVNIINALSYVCEDFGEVEKIENLLQNICWQYEKKPFSLEHYVVGYELTTRHLGNLLGNIGKYHEAMEVSNKGILLGMQMGRGAILGTALYDVGWDMEQIWGEGVYTKEESLLYVKASYALRLLLGKKNERNFFKSHVKEKYGIELKY